MPPRPLFLSPHLDDAVFACGRLLASLPHATVATVFAGRPETPVVTEWDRASGFAPGDDVIGARRDEDRRALGLLGARPLWLDFRDSQYAAPPSAAALARSLHALLEAGDPGAVFFPLGLFHADHRLTREAGLLLMARHPRRQWFAYADALYRRIDGLAQAALAELQRRGFAPAARGFDEAPGADARKAAAVACYRSQLRALATPGRPGHADLVAPEEYWRVRPPEGPWPP